MPKMKTTSFNQLLDKEFGKTGELNRDLFELAVESRVLGQRLRDLRLARGWTRSKAELTDWRKAIVISLWIP